jgi:VIT1/CCC1 family predicted Fe2+/Mn2+ transporter
MTEPSEIELDEQIIASQEFQKTAMAAKLNWLRAGVLGANDGIMSTSGLVIGVAGANPSNSGAILIAGVAALVAGAISMAGGEYTSVSAQKDSEKAALEIERRELAENPELELRELTWFYEQKGMSLDLAQQVATQLTAKDALKAHAEAELGIEVGVHSSPTQAAVASFVAFAAGGVLPLLAITSFSPDTKILATFIATLVALVITGYVGAKIGGAGPLRAVLRNLFVSSLTMGATYLIGALIGGSVAG